MKKERLQELAGITEAHVSHFEDLPSKEETKRLHAIGAICSNYAKGHISQDICFEQLKKQGLGEKQIKHLLGAK